MKEIILKMLVVMFIYIVLICISDSFMSGWLGGVLALTVVMNIKFNK